MPYILLYIFLRYFIFMVTNWIVAFVVLFAAWVYFLWTLQIDLFPAVPIKREGFRKLFLYTAWNALFGG